MKMRHKYKQFKRGSILIIIAILVMALVLLFSMLTSAAMIGDRSGLGGGSGGKTAPDGSPIGEVFPPTEPVVPSGVCSHDILSQAQQYAGVMYSQSGANGTHCGYASPQGRAGANHLDCSGIVSRVYRELGLITPSGACYGTSTIPHSGQLQEISASQIQPGDIVNIAGSHVVFYVSGNINGTFNTFSCKKTGVPCGSGQWWRISGQRYYHPKKCNTAGGT